MRSPYTQLYVHLVWATWDRMPLLTPTVEPAIHRCVVGVAGRMGVEALAVGGVEDHVHLLARMPTTVAVAELVKRIKGVSSRLANDELGLPFRWQGGYGAFSVSRSDLPRVRRYVHRQREHHRTGRLTPALEPPPDRPAAG